MSSVARSGNAGPIFTRGMTLRLAGIWTGERQSCRDLHSLKLGSKKVDGNRVYQIAHSISRGRPTFTERS
jgi:hypothetical protein